MERARHAVARIGSVILFGILTVVAVVVMFHIARADKSLAIDSHNEIYPESKEFARGQEPVPVGERRRRGTLTQAHGRGGRSVVGRAATMQIRTLERDSTAALRLTRPPTAGGAERRESQPTGSGFRD